MPRMKAKIDERVFERVPVETLVREVLAEFDKKPEDCSDRSALVFVRDSIGRLVLREVPVLTPATNRSCERCRKAPPETVERLCLSCAKEVFGG